MGGGGRHANTSSAPDENEDDDNDEDISGDSDDEQVMFGYDIEGGDADEVGESALSLFGPERFPSAAAFWCHAEAEYGFSLAKLRKEVGVESWTDYHRMRLVNHLRKMGPTAAKNEICKISRSSEIWSNDELLQPVLGDDVLLFEDDENDWDDCPEHAVTPGCQTGVAGDMGSANFDKDEEIARLRLELASARRLLSAFGAGDDCSGYSSQRLPPSISALVTGSVSRRFYDFFKDSPTLMKDKVVLNADCGAGALSCLCARLGTLRVLASESSLDGQHLARKMIEANKLEQLVELIPVDSAGDLPAEILSSSGKGQGVCDLLFSERFFTDLRLSPSFFSLLAMRRFLRPGGRVLPGRLRILAVAIGSSSSSDNPFSSCGIDLSALDACLPRVEVTSVLATCITSLEPAIILEADLTTADIQHSLSLAQSFKFKLIPGSCTTAIAISFEAGMDDKSSDAKFDLHSAPHECAQTIFHFPMPGPPPLRPLKLMGDEFDAVDGSLTVRRVSEGRSLQVHMDFCASPKNIGTASALQIGATFIVDS